MFPALDREAQRATESQRDADARELDDALAQLYRELEDGILSIGGWTKADEIIGMNHNDIRKIVQRKAPDRRGLAIDDVLPIARRIMQQNPRIGTRIGAALVTALDLQVWPRVSLSDAKRAELLTAYVLAMPLGKQLLAEALGGLVVVDDKTRADKLEAFLRSMPLGEQHVEHALGGRR